MPTTEAAAGVELELGIDTRITLLLAGLLFVWALALGVWKYRQMATSSEHVAHPYVDIAHRAALLYSFATLLLAAFVELSGWPTAVNLTTALVVIFFFFGAIAGYTVHGFLRDTDNQFAHPVRAPTRSWWPSSSARSVAPSCCSPASSVPSCSD